MIYVKHLKIEGYVFLEFCFKVDMQKMQVFFDGLLGCQRNFENKLSLFYNISETISFQKWSHSLF